MSYVVHLPCPDKFICPDLRNGNITTYLNLAHIKESLHLSPDFTFEEIDWELNTAYVESGTANRQTTPFVAHILDAHRTQTADKSAYLGDIRVLVLNGNDDPSVSTQGNTWLYEKLLWSGVAGYRAASWKALQDVNVTGEWKATRDGRLAFVAVDGAGHMVPGDQKEGAYKILQKWMRGDYH